MDEIQMTGNDAEIFGAVVGVAGLGVVGVKMFIDIFRQLTDHGIRIEKSDEALRDTAMCLERTSLTVAKLEERTKML